MEGTFEDSRNRVPIGRLFLALAALVSFFGLTILLGRMPFFPDPQLYGLLQISSGVLAFTFVSAALVRFRGTRDRTALVLAFAFALSGAFSTGASLSFFRQAEAETGALVGGPLAWWISRTLLGALMLLALVANRGTPLVRYPGREIGVTLFLVALCSYFTVTVFETLPVSMAVFPRAFFPSPFNLLTASIFLLAAAGFRTRLNNADAAFDRGLWASAWLSVAGHLAAARSAHLFDAEFAAAQVFMVVGYAVALGGALVGNARVFDRVHELASRDPLTSLGNYRHLLDVLAAEMHRSGRTGRPFAVVLLDLDGLKHINDRFGHLRGSEALCRLARILSGNCRSIDTAARYGGDEFALVLPETDQRAAQEVAARICERLATDQHGPRLSVSLGVAIYPRNGASIEQLLAAADQALYAMKSLRKEQSSKERTPATGWLFEQ